MPFSCASCAMLSPLGIPIFEDILARKSDIRQCRGPPLAEHLLWFFRGGIFEGAVCQAAKDVEATVTGVGDKSTDVDD